ncbi:hypothetical protein SAMN05216312_101294 [Cohnella sp. OV330]|uniref:hypothetical protein n=1 Tax=Cohnella sp. OV330 TaxID=1855288 RepID=UPI0008E4CE9C|nr:hypothetical protein [Cohnella sp. OV330]SFA75402.1 hypothetical protein SAMN05216312_101294 [Cohnella sp. OV330]
MIKTIKFLLSVLITPLALFFVWVLNFHPYSLLAKHFHWTIHSKNPETVEAAINVAVIVALLNIFGKIWSKFKRPVKVLLKVSDPLNKIGKNEIMYNANTGSLKKLVLKIDIDYKNNFWRIVTAARVSHLIVLHWNNIFKVDCEVDQDYMEKANQNLLINIGPLIGSLQNEVSMTHNFYFTIKNTSVNRGAFVPEFRVYRGNNLLNFLLICLLKLAVAVEIEKLDVHLEKEN